MSSATDPFAPPEVDPMIPEPPLGSAMHHPLADRGRRLAGAVVDNALYFCAAIPGMILAFTGLDGNVDDMESKILVTVLGPIGALYAVQMYMVSTRGQTFAKRWLSMRVVRTSGAPAGFLHGVALRSWVIGLLSFIPLVGNFIGLADALCIFGERQQCLHDMIADTHVVDVSRA